MSAPVLTQPQSSSALPSELTRCDACGAQGKVRVVLDSGLDLVFCGHHTNALQDAIFPVSTTAELLD